MKCLDIPGQKLINGPAFFTWVVLVCFTISRTMLAIAALCLKRKASFLVGITELFQELSRGRYPREPVNFPPDHPGFQGTGGLQTLPPALGGSNPR